MGDTLEELNTLDETVVSRSFLLNEKVFLDTAQHLISEAYCTRGYQKINVA